MEVQVDNTPPATPKLKTTAISLVFTYQKWQTKSQK